MQVDIDPEQIKTFQTALLAWFKKYGRDLPWRKTRNPYHILVSELMLQQTQVARVEKDYYHQFLQQFPTIEVLARASEEEVIAAWQGLGYYNRAKNLHSIAKIIVIDYKGEFPSDHETLRNLPGIGPYTAGAILSFAFESDYPIVDTNVERIVKRVFLHNHKIKVPAQLDKTIWHISEKILLKGEAWTFNQAILDFGALICTAIKPKCSKCPMKSICKYFQAKISKKDSIIYWLQS